MKIYMIRFFWLWVGLGSSYASNGATPIYRAIDIGLLQGREYSIPYDFNNQGTVVGYGGGGTGATNTSPFIWDEAGGLRQFTWPAVGDGELGFPESLNDLGQFVGSVVHKSGSVEPAIFEADGSVNYFLEGSWAEKRLGYIAQIKNSGQVLGESYAPGRGYEASPWVWTPEKGITDPPPEFPSGFDAYQMNERNQVVGASYKECESSRAYVLDLKRQKFQPLGKGTPPNSSEQTCGLSSSANAINDLGEVVGIGTRRPFQDEKHSFIWTAKDGYKLIPTDHDPIKYDITPTSINNASQVVGFFSSHRGQSLTYSLYFWSKNAGWHELADLLDPSDPLTSQIVLKGQGATSGGVFLERIPKINDQGQILVTGSYRSDGKDPRPGRAFLLVPVEKPASNRSMK